MRKWLALIAMFLFFSQTVFAQGEALEVKFLYGTNCSACARLKEHLNIAKEEFGEKIEIIEIEFNENLEETISLQEEYGVPFENIGSIPKLFIVGEYCINSGECKEFVDNKMEEFLAGQQRNGNNGTGDENKPLPPSNGNEKKPTEINFLQLMGLALVDAVNPCELAVLIILMTAILSRYPNQKMKALKAGLAFSLAVFLMYLSFGVLIILGFKFVMGFTQVSGTWFYQVLGGLAIFLGAWNLKDAFWGKNICPVIEVPHGWRPRMKQIIQGTTSTAGAFVAGIIVSFFLTPCTSGPYFVAGGILARIELLEALPFLLIYLAVFISPMIVITLIAFFGFMAVEDMSEWKAKHTKTLHLIAGLLLLGLGLAMITGMI